MITHGRDLLIKSNLPKRLSFRKHNKIIPPSLGPSCTLADTPLLRRTAPRLKVFSRGVFMDLLLSQKPVFCQQQKQTIISERSINRLYSYPSVPKRYCLVYLEQAACKKFSLLYAHYIIFYFRFGEDILYDKCSIHRCLSLVDHFQASCKNLYVVTFL